MKIIGNLVLTGYGRNKLKNANISNVRNKDYIIPDWNYQNIFKDNIYIDDFKNIFNENYEQFFKIVSNYINYSKQYQLMPNAKRIQQYFLNKINNNTAKKIIKLITIKQQIKFKYEDNTNITELKNIKTILINKHNFVKLLKNNKLQIINNMFYFKNTRIVTYNTDKILALTNNNTLCKIKEDLIV